MQQCCIVYDELKVGGKFREILPKQHTNTYEWAKHNMLVIVSHSESASDYTVESNSL